MTILHNVPANIVLKNTVYLNNTLTLDTVTIQYYIPYSF